MVETSVIEKALLQREKHLCGVAVTMKHHHYLKDLGTARLTLSRSQLKFIPCGNAFMARGRLIAGRVATSTAIAVFVACYLYSITTYGLAVTVGIGWFPAAITSWAVAVTLNSFAKTTLKYAYSVARYLASK